MAPVFREISVKTWGAHFSLRSPRTHSTYPVAEIFLGLSVRFFTLRTKNLIGASMATYTHNSDRIPRSVCSYTE